jgi:hypothetical protein
MNASQRTFTLATATAVALLASACGAAVVSQGPTSGPSSVASAALAAQPTATPAPTPPATPSARTPASPASPSSSPTPAPTFAYDATALTAGSHAALVMGSGTYPGYTVVVPAGWFDVGVHHFVQKYPTVGGPVLGLSVWDVGQVFRDPCHWQGQGFDPGPSVGALVAALVAQPMRNATRPTDVTLAGSKGRYLELSVPADLKSSKWTNFDACDVDEGGSHDFQGWLGNGMGNRYEQVPGQVDRLWVLDVNGQRLVVDATYSPDTTPADRAELASVVASLRFVAP